MTIATARKSDILMVGTNPVEVMGVWKGGGAAANCTRVLGRGVSSVNYNAATGQYKITFAEVGEGTQPLVSMNVQAAAGAASTFVARPTVYSASGKTLTFDVTDVATPTNHDLALTEFVHFRVLWDDSDAP